MPKNRIPSPFHRLRLRIEALRLAARMRRLAGLLDVPHEVAEHAQTRILRLRRRAEAVARIIG